MRAVKPTSSIETWEDWPDDVRPTLRHWNHASLARLRFTYTKGFTCSDCWTECVPNRYGDAVLDNVNLCDGCLCDVARDYLGLTSDKQAQLDAKAGRLAEWVDDRVWRWRRRDW